MRMAHKHQWLSKFFLAGVAVAMLAPCCWSQQAKGDIKVYIPRTQKEPPGPPLTPAEAIKKMTVPEGFHVELVAAEPDLLNPVAMAFDDWIDEIWNPPD